MNSLDNSISVFKDYLNANYGDERNIFKIDYQEPYKGQLGSKSAEIYCEDNLVMSNIIKTIEALGLKIFPSHLIQKEEEIDVITSCAESRGGVVQILFNNDKALKLFKEQVTGDFKEKQEKEAAIQNHLKKYADINVEDLLEMEF
jgi:hypothetical protein